MSNLLATRQDWRLVQSKVIRTTGSLVSSATPSVSLDLSMPPW